MKTIAIAGTFDSKGEEFLYVKKLVEKLGLQTYMIHLLSKDLLLKEE